MGTICILLGIIILILFTGAGFFAANAVVANELYMSLLALSNVTTAYLVVIGVMFFVGLLICISLVMNGLIYNKTLKTYALLRRVSRH